MTIRHDVYVYNESNGLVFTCKAPNSRKSKAWDWDRLKASNSILAIELRQDDACVVRVLVDGDLSTQEQDEWVEYVTGHLNLPTNHLALCGGMDYVEDPASDENECVQFAEVPAGDYLAELYTYFTSPNFDQERSPFPEPADPGNQLYVDFVLRLTPWIEGTNCTPEDDNG